MGCTVIGDKYCIWCDEVEVHLPPPLEQETHKGLWFLGFKNIPRYNI